MVTPPGRQPKGLGSVPCDVVPQRDLRKSGLEQTLLRRLQWSLRACSEWVKARRRALPHGCIDRNYMASSLHAAKLKPFLDHVCGRSYAYLTSMPGHESHVSIHLAGARIGGTVSPIAACCACQFDELGT